MHGLEIVPLVKAVGYPGVAAIVFFESGVFFGFFLPGASMLFTAGLLSSQGLFNPWILIPLVTVSAILGDSTGYWFGRKVGIRLFLRPDSRFFHHGHLEQAEDFYEKYGTRAIFLGRFVPIVRTFAPIVAGVVQMNYKTFLTYNIAGALTWAAGVTFAGYYLGAKVPVVGQYLTPIVILIIVASCIPIFWDTIQKRRLPQNS